MGRGTGHGRPACMSSACARWATWPPFRPRPWSGGSGKASGLHLAALARGEDPSPVTPDRPAKSIGHEETFSQDLVDPRELERHVLRMAESVATMLRGSSSAARTVTVKVKFRDLSLQTRSHTLARPITTGGAHRAGGAALPCRASTRARGSGSSGVERLGTGRGGRGSAVLRPRRRA